MPEQALEPLPVRHGETQDTDRSGLNYWHPESQLWKWLDLMTSADPYRNSRQLAIIGTDGNASVFTGSECLNGQVESKESILQCRNILTGPKVIEAMGWVFEDTNGTLAERMIARFMLDKKQVVTGGEGNQLLFWLLGRLGIWRTDRPLSRSPC